VTTTAELSGLPQPSESPPLLRRLRPDIGLRRRIMAFIIIGAITLSTFLAFSTYGFVRSSLVTQRDDAAIAASRLNARTVERELGSNTVTDPTAQLSLSVQRYLLFYRNQFWNGVPPFDQLNLSQELLDTVLVEGTPARQVVRLDDDLYLVVGWSVPGVGGYFEYFSLDEADGTLRSLRLALIVAAAVTTSLGVLLAVFASRRAVRPVSTAAQAASAIAGGRLDTRLPKSDDPDLAVLTDSFNDMAEALQQRVERDARFASDVSHELRSPLMTLSASVEVMEARRHELPERAQAALDLLASDVVRFQGLVEDLLEISRFDAGAIRLHMEELLAAEFVRQAVAVSSLPETPIVATNEPNRP
jgi:two-component system sensor histidine kinase MtrB